MKLGPPGFRRFLLNLVPNKSLKRARDIVDVMHRTSVEIFQAKKLALQQGDEAALQQVGRGVDLMSLLCMCWLPPKKFVVLTWEDSEGEYGSDGTGSPPRFRTNSTNDVRPATDIFQNLSLRYLEY